MTLPRLAAGRFVSRFRVAGWVRDNATPPREAAWAGLAVATSWVLRTLAIFVLLAALGLGTNFALALAFVCASAASAVLPVAPAGAAMQAGAGAAILVASGVQHASRRSPSASPRRRSSSPPAPRSCVALAAWHAQGRLAGARFDSAGRRRLAGAQDAHRRRAGVPGQPDADRRRVVVVAELAQVHRRRSRGASARTSRPARR